MKVTGIVESLDWDERGGKLKVSGWERTIWVSELQKKKMGDVKPGDKVTVDTSPGKWYDFLTTIEQGEAASLAAGPQTGQSESKQIPSPAEQPPKPTDIVAEDENLAGLANRIVMIRDGYELSISKDILSLHWEIGEEICKTRFTGLSTYRHLSDLTGVSHMNLWYSVAFYKKYPKRDYEIKAWRRHVAELPEIKETVSPLPKDKFTLIYADPPWQYEFSAVNRLAPETHYATLTTDQICNLNIPTDDNAVLFLWSPAPKIEEALDVMEKWGFKYRTNFVWTKDNFGMGYWTRAQHELLLLGVKGEVAPPEESDRYPSVVAAPRTEHSAKPPVFYEMIEKMFPDQKKIELFARGPERKGWIFWGIEVEQ